MTKETGTTTDGKESQQCLDNTGEREFVVIEFDISEEGNWAPYVRDWRSRGITTIDANVALIWSWLLKVCHECRLPWPCTVAESPCTLGFPCVGLEEEQVRPFMARAVKLGADKATWTRCQLVRMPMA